MTTDLSTIRAEDRSAHLLHPKTGDELGLVFELRSPYDDEVQKVQREWQNHRLHPKRRNKSITMEEMESFQDKRIVAAVKGWAWEDAELTINGDQPEYSPQVLKGWLKDEKMKWLREFLVEETEDLASFF
jgi:hypothetical protein